MKTFARLVVAGALALAASGCDDTCDPTIEQCPSPDAGAQPDAGSSPDAGTAGCPALTGQEIAHQNDVTTAETWAGDGVVHRVTFGFTVRPGGTLTLAPCAVVKVNAGLLLTVNGTAAQPARLVSQGTADKPVLVTNAVAGRAWGGVRAYGASSTFDLAYTTFENGGSGTSHGFTVNLRGEGAPEREAIPVLKADHLTIKNSAGTGLVMESAAAFTADSTEVTITGGGALVNGDYALEISAIAAGTIPKLTATGNAHDAVRVGAGSLFISRDLTLKNLGVPYYFYFDRVRVTDQTGAATPTLTVQPGVELRFDDYLMVGYLNVGIADNPGRLVAVGTPSQHIVFTSSKASPQAGDWPGILLFNAAGSRLENVEIQYAGGWNGIVSANCRPAGSTDRAALFIGSRDGTYIPSPGDFAAVTVDHCASHGINAMWQATTFGPDLTGGFIFGALGGCRQTKNSLPTGCGGAAGCLVP